MRFERLHLMRFGAFTDRAIRFRGDARLHVVYGPNEAGKSTTLAALSSLLFGFPHQKSHDFLHEASALRIGATVRSSGGTELSFRRRKGTKATLIADEDGETALKDDALSSFVGRMTRSVFENAFGLDSERLREGAETMLANEGELGGTLLAAASGMTGLRDLRSHLETEADAIYTPQGRKKEFNALAHQWAEAKQRMRDRELRSGDWKKLVGEIEDLEHRFEAAKQERVATAKRRGELMTLRQLHPVTQDIDALLRKVADHRHLASLKRGFGEELRAALADRAASRTAQAQARERLETARNAAVEIDLDGEIFAHAKAIEALHARLGDYLEKRSQTPRVDAERRSFDREIEDRFARLGLTSPEERDLQPTSSALALAEELADEGERIARDAEAFDAALAEEKDNEADLRRNQPSSRLVDPKPLRDWMSSLRAEIESVSELQRLRTEHRQETRRLSEDASRLRPSVANLSAFAAAALPQEALIVSQRDAMARARNEIGALTKKRREIDEESEANAALLRELERGTVLPNRSAIEEARSARDAAFVPLAAFLTEDGARPSTAETQRLVAAFRERSVAADRLADAALEDAERVQRHTAIVRRNGELERAAAEIGASLTQEKERLDACRRDFAAPFEALGVAVEEPAVMLDWLRELRLLLEAQRKTDHRGEQIAELTSRETKLHAALAELAKSLWIETVTALPTLSLAKACDEKIADIAEGWAASRGHAERLADATFRIERSLGRQQANATKRQDWRIRADAAFASLGLPEGAQPAQARAMLAIWRELPALRSERRNRQDRVDGMARDARHYEEEVAALTMRVAPDLRDLPADRAVEEMRALSEMAHRAHAKLAERRAALDQAGRDAAACDARCDTAERDLARLVKACPPGADPEAIVAEVTERDRISNLLAQTRARLVDLAPTWSEDEVRRRVAEFDPERADLDIEELEREEETLSTRSSEIYADLAARRKERDVLTEGEGAEAAYFEQKSIEAEMIEMARRWAVLKIAGSLVSSTLDRQRQDQDAPLMRRAGEHFRTLTGGAYAALSQQFGENDRIDLIAVKHQRDGASDRLRIGDLSDGTRNQLYLALRLAFVEDYASRNEPVPFVGDDIFQTFDDERTAAGLATLAAASGHTQPILFTHHRRVVEIAKDTLGTGADIIEL